MGIMMIRLRFFLQIYGFYLILRKVKFKVFEDEKRYNLYSRRSGKVEHPGLWLSADKTTITADGEDMVTFTVTLDDVDVTSQCSFCSQESCYVSNTFSTTTAGEYVFHATYLETNENSANEVTITAQ